MTTAPRLRSAFAAPGRPRLVAYLTCGDPAEATTVAIALAAVSAGADVLELGAPYSEPSADGPAIQRAMERALSRGGGLTQTLRVARRLRDAGCEVPLVLFGYYNPIFVRGAGFAHAALAAGVDAALVVDLPLEEQAELLTPLRAVGLDLVPLVAPTTTSDRIERIRALAPPFVYCVSMTGVTGSALASPESLATRLAQVRTGTEAKVVVGFGIATPNDVRRLAPHADGIVVGSAIVRTIEEHPGHEAAAVARLVGSLAAALR